MLIFWILLGQIALAEVLVVTWVVEWEWELRVSFIEQELFLGSYPLSHLRKVLLKFLVLQCRALWILIPQARST